MQEKFKKTILKFCISFNLHYICKMLLMLTRWRD